MPVRLPNGDIYDPPPLGAEPKPNVRLDTNVAPDPVADAVAAGPQPVCPWCGQQAETEAAFKQHVVAYHAKDIGESAEEARRAEVASLAKRQRARREATLTDVIDKAAKDAVAKAAKEA